MTTLNECIGLLLFSIDRGTSIDEYVPEDHDSYHIFSLCQRKIESERYYRNTQLFKILDETIRHMIANIKDS